MREMGLRLSIDDFGTGYSSLAYLKRLPLDELEIDRSFVMQMHRDPAARKIVRNLGLAVVAEGIEDRAAWDTLRAMGCDEGQGYYIAKPMPEADFGPWVAQRHAAPARAEPAVTPAVGAAVIEGFIAAG